MVLQYSLVIFNFRENIKYESCMEWHHVFSDSKIELYSVINGNAVDQTCILKIKRPSKIIFMFWDKSSSFDVKNCCDIKKTILVRTFIQFFYKSWF